MSSPELIFDIWPKCHCALDYIGDENYPEITCVKRRIECDQFVLTLFVRTLYSYFEREKECSLLSQFVMKSASFLLLTIVSVFLFIFMPLLLGHTIFSL